MSTTSATAGAGLTRITVVAPDRRLDVVLPAGAPLVDLVPGLVARAGESMGDRGEAHGGWRLASEDGTALALDSSLGQQHVADGRCVYLVPADVDWPEPDYDDVVEAIADSSRQRARNWTPATTRTAGLAGALLLLLAGLVQVLRADVTVGAAGGLLIGVGSVVLLAAVVVARPLSDARAGAAVGVVGLCYLSAGGLLVTSLPGTPMASVDGIDLLAGSAALTLGSLVGYTGIVWGMRVFVGGIVAGLAGALAGTASVLGLGPAACSALVVAVLTGAVAVFPLWAMRLGRVPVPTLPSSADDVLADQPRPDPAAVRTAVLRADEVLTGLLGGAAVVIVACQVRLMQEPGTVPVVLAVVVGAALALRAQLFPTIRHRIGLLLVGAAGLVGAALVLTRSATSGEALLLTLLGVVTVAGLLLAAGVRYSRSQPSPYLPRYADIAEMLLLVSVLPLAGAVLGLYAFARGLAG